MTFPLLLQVVLANGLSCHRRLICVLINVTERECRKISSIQFFVFLSITRMLAFLYHSLTNVLSIALFPE